MAVTVTPNLTQAYNASTTNSWTSDGPGISVISGFQREGTENLGFQISQETAHAWKTITSTDFSNTRVYPWVRVHISLDDKVNGGIRIVLGDGTNRVAYFVGGDDDFGFQLGSWSCMMLDTANLAGMNSAVLAGTLAGLEGNLTAITEVGVGFVATIKAQGNVENAFWDICHFGTGLTLTGGTSSDPGTFNDVVALDESTSNAWGIIRELQAGVFGIQGDLTWGDNSGTSDFWFQDDSAVVVLEDHVHGTGTPLDMQLSVVGNATATTQHLELGISVSSGDNEEGRNGVTFINAAEGVLPVTWDSSDVDLDDLLLFGCTFQGIRKSGVVSPVFSSDATLGPTHRISGCTFAGCGQVDSGATVVRNCIFTSHAGTDASLLWQSGVTDVKNIQFIANTDATNDPAGIEHTVAETVTYDNLTFSANDFDIFNSSGGDLTVDAINGSDPSTSRNSGSGTTTINNAVSLTVTAVDEANNPVPGVQMSIFRTDTNPLTELMNEDTDINGVATETFNFPGTEVPIIVRARKSDSDPQYFPFETTGTITSGGFDLQVVMIRDNVIN